MFLKAVSWGYSCSTYSSMISSLLFKFLPCMQRLYAGDTKAYASNFNIEALELFLYYDLKKLIHGLTHYSIKLQKRDS